MSTPGPPDGPAVRVLVVDDHRGFAQLLAVALDGEPDMHCVGTAGDGDEGVRLAGELCPQVALVDVQMPHEDGISVTRRLRDLEKAPAVVVMTAHRDPVWADRAAAAGALGFVHKNGSLDTLLDTVRHARLEGQLPP